MRKLGRNRRRKISARGHAAFQGELRRIPVGFDEETFGEIELAAAAAATSFAEQVRQLVELGLETRKTG